MQDSISYSNFCCYYIESMIIVINVFLNYILSDIDISTRDFFWLLVC